MTLGDDPGPQSALLATTERGVSARALPRDGGPDRFLRGVHLGLVDERSDRATREEAARRAGAEERHRLLPDREADAPAVGGIAVRVVVFLDPSPASIAAAVERFYETTKGSCLLRESPRPEGRP